MPVAESFAGRPAITHRGRRLVLRWLVALSLGVTASILVFPELFGLAGVLPFADIVAFRPVASVGLLALAGLALLVLRRWWPAALAVALVAAAALSAVLPRAVAGPAPPPGRALTLLSFNVHHGRADVSSLAAAIQASRPDLVVLPEAGESYRRRLMSLVADLHYRSWSTTPPGEPDGDGIVVLASAQLGRVTATPLKLGSEFPWMRVSGGHLGDVDVLAIHAAAPVAGRRSAWLNDLSLLTQWCTEGLGSHIMAGDVNATLDHAPLRHAVEGCTDAADDRGEGLAATWPSYWPRWSGVQIDHVFTSRDLWPVHAQVLDLPGSDHRALLVQITLPRA